MDTLKGSLYSKTMWFAAVLAVLSTVYANLDSIAPFVSKETLGVIGLTVSVCIAVLRTVTTMSLAAKTVAPTNTTVK